jgi:heme-degrading monooxygenase HmoA
MPAIETRLTRRAIVASGLACGVLATFPAQSQSGSPSVETTIRVDGAVTTLVNVFKVEPDTQPKLWDMLREATETMFSNMPGWIATNLLKSKDARQVIIYSQWRDAKDIDAFRQDPKVKPYLHRISDLAKGEAFTCDVSYSLHA